MSENENLFAPRFNIKDVKIHNQQRLFKSYFAIDRYDVSYKQFNGGESKVLVREIFERDAEAVAILAWDQKTDEIALIEQFRPGALKDEQSPWLIEIVAGMINKGESREEAAIREVKEEIGLEISPNDLYFVSSQYPSPGGISERVTLYIANTDLSHLGKHGGLACENEDIRVFKAPLDEAYAQVKNGRIHNSVAMIGIFTLVLEKCSISQTFAKN